MKNKINSQIIILDDGHSCVADAIKKVHINQAIQLKPYSGQIIPTSKEAVQAIKMTTSFDNIDISPGSSLEFSGKTLPKNVKIAQNSHLILDENTTCDDVQVLDNSQIHLATGSRAIKTVFRHSRTGTTAFYDVDETDLSKFNPKAVKVDLADTTFYNSNFSNVNSRNSCLYDCTIANSVLKNADVTHVKVHTLNKLPTNLDYTDTDYNKISDSVLFNTRLANEGSITIENAKLTNTAFIGKQAPLLITNSKIDKSYIINNSNETDELDNFNLIMDSDIVNLIVSDQLYSVSSRIAAPSMKPIISNKPLFAIDTKLQYDKPVAIQTKRSELNTYDVHEIQPTYVYNKLISYNENKRTKGELYSDGLDKIRNTPFNDFAKINDNIALVNSAISKTKSHHIQAESDDELDLN